MGDEKNIVTTINNDEIAKFEKMAEEWWDEFGKFKPLHKFNPVRIKFIKDLAISHFGINDLSGLKILDIGCGGGILAEPMARLGAEVTAIDASQKNINIAKSHCKKSGLNINYINCAVEDLAGKDNKFDIVLAMEIVEHVADIEQFLLYSANLVDEKGLFFVATINKTFMSFVKAIIGAEYILRWLPVGTHDWKKFLPPSFIDNILSNSNLFLKQLTGVSYNPFLDKWSLTEDVSVNYISVFESI